ncbi:MAG: metalloregulator ArsR/SmtB family transcription factor [Eubacteriales bacterium]|nr:metalloregulator ArsR/SmtB family transcription factor [Eubacteriales bacterium]
MEPNQIASLFKALADESRVKIVLALLKTDELCACKLLELVDCQQPTLSHHMKLLVDSGLVIARKDWKWTYYSIRRDRIQELVDILKP